MTEFESIRIRPYRDQDEDAVMRLIAACYGEQALDREQWLHNHFGLANAPNGMMLADVDGIVVGMQPMECYPFLLCGEAISGAVLTGVMVHPDWRRRGLFLRLLKACETRAWELGASFVTTMPNERSRLGFLKRGYIEPGERRLLILPLTRSKGVTGGWRRRLIDLAAQATLSSWRMHRQETKNVQEVSHLGTDVASMTQRVAGQWPGLIQIRSQSWMAWRYPSDRSDYRRFVAIGARNEVQALAVTAVEKREGLDVGYLLDVMGSDHRSIRNVTAFACHQLQNQGMQLVMSVVTSRALIRRLKAVGFLKVPRLLAPKRFYTVYRPGPGEEDRLTLMTHINSWYQTLGDWDNL